MRKHLVLTMALGAVIALTVAGVAMAREGHRRAAGNLEVTIDGPRRHAEGALEEQVHADHASPRRASIRNHRRHPAAGAERIHRRHRQKRHDQRQGPADCTSGQTAGAGHQARRSRSATTRSSAKARPRSRVAFPEQAPIPATSPLLVFNGGVKGGVTTLFIHAYLTVADPDRDRHHGENQEIHAVATASKRSPRSRRSPAAAVR